MQRLRPREESAPTTLGPVTAEATPAAEIAAPPAPTLRQLWQTLVADNPVYQRERRSLPGRKRKTARLERWTLRALSVPAYYGLSQLLFGPDRPVSATNLYAILACLAAAILVHIPTQAPQSISDEREKQTWDALTLTRLSPAQILVGKLLPRYGARLEIVAFLAPAIVLCGALGHVPLGSVALSLATLLASVLFAGAWEMRRMLFRGTSFARSGSGLDRAAAFPFHTPVLSWLIWMGGSALARLTHRVDAFLAFGPTFWYVALAPILIHPLGAFALTLPVWEQPLPFALPLGLRLAVVGLYLYGASRLTRALWRKTLAQFWDAAKDSAPTSPS